MKEKVEAALDKVRPQLQADGGDIELVDVKTDCQRQAAGPLRRLTNVTDDAQDGRRAILERTDSRS